VEGYTKPSAELEINVDVKYDVAGYEDPRQTVCNMLYWG
jgi:hypothetical protein